MKRISTYLTFASITAILLVACTATAPYFTTMDRVLSLNVNMTYDQVKDKLGMPAYDLYINDRDNKAVYVWYYKHTERKEKASRMMYKSGGTSGEEVVANQSKLFCIFDNDRKLESIITSDGRKDAPYLQLMDNSFREIANNPDTNYIIPVHFEKYRKSPGIPGMMLKKKKKDK